MTPKLTLVGGTEKEKPVKTLIRAYTEICANQFCSEFIVWRCYYPANKPPPKRAVKRFKQCAKCAANAWDEAQNG